MASEHLPSAPPGCVDCSVLSGPVITRAIQSGSLAAPSGFIAPLGPSAAQNIVIVLYPLSGELAVPSYAARRSTKTSCRSLTFLRADVVGAPVDELYKAHDGDERRWRAQADVVTGCAQLDHYCVLARCS